MCPWILWITLLLLLSLPESVSTFCFSKPLLSIIHWRLAVEERCSNRSMILSAAAAAKRKLSMAEKRKRRANRQVTGSSEVIVSRPPCEIDFKSSKPIIMEDMSTSAHSDDGPPSEPTPNHTDERMARIPNLETVGDKSTEPMERAKQLLEAQRQSVAMLTTVRECVEALDSQAIQSSINEKGYSIIDNFIHNEGILNQLQEEGHAMLPYMQVDTDDNLLLNVGTGEYVVPIKGGDDQYILCPRCVELVVSTTKHVPPHLSQESTLDASVCMATLRTFDRKAWLASLRLLTGKNATDVADQTNDQQLSTQRPFGVVGNTEENDRRKLTFFYYILPNTWNDLCGGGIAIKDGDVQIHAKRDRLVMLKSDTCWFQRMPWKGGDEDGNGVGSCLELHFIQKTSPLLA